MAEKKICLAQIAYRSEWALAKFFESLKSPDIANRFELKVVCGVEENVREAIDSLKKSIAIRLEHLIKVASKENGFRFGNRLDEILNCVDLIIRLGPGMVDYFKVNTINSLPDKLYASGIDAVVVHSLNPTHLGYIVNAIEHGKHVLCEKPLVPVLDRFGKPSSKELDELEGIVQKKDPKVILMDAEHYSHKKPAIIFYENFWEIVGTSKIRRVEGEIKETDDPHFWRTKEILSGNNQTGILGDTMCHLLAFISNLGGRAIPQKRRYDLFEDDQVQYHTDTYDEVDFSIENVNGDYFTKDASASFVVCKFMDRFQQPQTKESKFIKFILNDNSEVVINFAEGSIKKVKDGQEKSYSFRYPLSGNEYVNILHCFYEGICNEVSPITGFGNSIRTLRSILSSYQLPNGDNARVKVYKTSE